MRDNNFPKRVNSIKVVKATPSISKDRVHNESQIFLCILTLRNVPFAWMSLYSWSMLLVLKGLRWMRRRLRLSKNDLSVRDFRNFHDLARFYKRFVRNFSTLVAPLTKMIKQSVGFKWGEAQERVLI